MVPHSNIISLRMYLPDELVDTWMPVQALDLGGGQYKILPIDNYDPELERWEFPPGSVVRAEQKTLYHGTKLVDVLVAVTT